jgi:hypothetical protein
MTPRTTTTGPSVRTGAANLIGAAFYLTVALIALVGQTLAATEWLGWPVVFALPAVAALELGGIALSALADVRRRLGERALAARVLSAGVAGFAAVFNWVGHADHRQGVFFAGMSALGYTVWLINAGARRRDQLRADGNLPPVPPAYGVWQWARHPLTTRRARALAQADPALGLYGSLRAASIQERVERRQAAIAEALRLKVTAAVDPLTARIAVATFDLDEIAARLAAGADYDGLTALIAADLTPARLTATDTPAETSSTPATGGTDAAPVVVTPERDPDTSATAPVPAAGQAPTPDVAPAGPGPKPTTRKPTTRKRQPSAAERVAKAVARSPRASDATIAARLELSEATVKRHRRQAVDSVSTASAPTPALHAV